MTRISIDQAMQLAARHHQTGRLAEAGAIYRQVLAANPDHADALQMCGILAVQSGQVQAGINLIQRSLAVNPKNASCHNNLGKLLLDLGQVDASVESCRRAIAIQPDLREAYLNLGNALRYKGEFEQAIAACRQALRLKADYPEAYLNLANALGDNGQFDEAIAAYAAAIRLRPDYAEAHISLASTLRDAGKLDEAVASCRRALEINPNYSEAHHNLGGVYKDQGRLDLAVDSLATAVSLEPDSPTKHSNLVYTLQFHPAYTPEKLLDAAKQWSTRHESPLIARRKPHENDWSQDRPLRIGYVSPDFRDHCQSFFTRPLLAHHDPKQVEVFCYAQVPRPDSVTADLRSHVAQWRSLVAVSDADAAEMIRQDRIDILVDLALHMGSNRLTLFALKPAPIQVTWLGYPGTTGLAAMDYRLTDPWLDPPGDGDRFYSERSIRLPETFWCYDPLTAAPVVNELPALTSGRITFGSLNNFVKVTEQTLDLWARVLRKVPNSRLLLLTPRGSARKRVSDALADRNVSPSRLELIDRQPREKYLELYQRIDIALDTVPINGHTTSLDSFWMGVPVITTIGTNPMGRGGWSQLSNLGLAELAAESESRFVEIVAALAADLPRLATMRSTLRRRMELSPLMNAPRFARNMESAYRAMWQNQLPFIAARA